MRRRIQWSHKKRAAEQKPAGVETTVEIVAPMRSVPLWLIDNTVMKVSMTEEAPEEFADGAATRGYKGWRGFWREVRERLTPAGTASKIYEYAGSRNSMWAEAFKYIDVLSTNGEPVGWYDLDGGLAQYVTLYDLLFEKQPLIADGRKLFMMTETMWENADYPPEVGGRTTSKEAAERGAVESSALVREDAVRPSQKELPPFLYHGTTVANGRHIKASGLLTPQIGPMVATAYGTEHRPLIFATTKIADAEQYALGPDGEMGKGAIVVIRPRWPEWEYCPDDAEECDRTSVEPGDWYTPYEVRIHDVLMGARLETALSHGSAEVGRLDRDARRSR